MKTQVFFFNFGGCSCEITGPQKQINYLIKCYLKSPFSHFISAFQDDTNGLCARLVIRPLDQIQNNEDVFHLSSEPRKLVFSLRCSENVFFLFPVVEQVLRKIFYILFFKSGGFVVHASAVVYKNNAYVFAGPSGCGKSTVVLKLKKENSSISIISDNNVYIKKVGTRFYIYPPAFLEWNLSSHQLTQNTPYVVKGFMFLNKNRDDINKNRYVDLPFLFNKAIGQIQIPFSSLTTSELNYSKKLLFDFISSLMKDGSVSTLSFTLRSNVFKQIFGKKTNVLF